MGGFATAGATTYCTWTADGEMATKHDAADVATTCATRGRGGLGDGAHPQRLHLALHGRRATGITGIMEVESGTTGRAAVLLPAGIAGWGLHGEESPGFVGQGAG